MILMAASHFLPAQANACGLTSIKYGRELVYPPIAIAAHVQGTATLRATFQQDGKVSNVESLSSPRMLEAAAIAYVRTLRANAFVSPRECTMAVAFRFDGEPVECSASNDLRTYLPRLQRIDPQHVSQLGMPA